MNIWLASKTIKLNPEETRKLIRGLRIRDKRAIIVIWALLVSCPPGGKDCPCSYGVNTSRIG